MTVTWVCPRDGNRRDVPSAHVGSGAPACPVCKGVMVPVAEEQSEPLTIPGLAQALAKADQEQEPVIAGFDGGMGKP